MQWSGTLHPGGDTEAAGHGVCAEHPRLAPGVQIP